MTAQRPGPARSRSAPTTGRRASGGAACGCCGPTPPPIVQVVAVAVVFSQLYRYTRLDRTANTQRILGVASAVLLQLAQDAALARLWGAGPEEVARLTELDKQPHGQLLAFCLLIDENGYHENQHGWINRETYVARNNELRAFVAEKHLERWWGALARCSPPSRLYALRTMFLANAARRAPGAQGLRPGGAPTPAAGGRARRPDARRRRDHAAQHRAAGRRARPPHLGGRRPRPPLGPGPRARARARRSAPSPSTPPCARRWRRSGPTRSRRRPALPGQARPLHRPRRARPPGHARPAGRRRGRPPAPLPPRRRPPPGGGRRPAHGRGAPGAQPAGDGPDLPANPTRPRWSGPRPRSKRGEWPGRVVPASPAPPRPTHRGAPGFSWPPGTLPAPRRPGGR